MILLSTPLFSHWSIPLTCPCQHVTWECVKFNILISPVFQTRDVLVRIRIRVRILGSIPLTNGPSDLQYANKIFFAYYLLKVHLHHPSQIKTRHKEATKW